MLWLAGALSFFFGGAVRVWADHRDDTRGQTLAAVMIAEAAASRSRPGCEINGGRTRARTLDPLIKSQLLYQLSYAPIEPAAARKLQRAGCIKGRRDCPAAARLVKAQFETILKFSATRQVERLHLGLLTRGMMHLSSTGAP